MPIESPQHLPGSVILTVPRPMVKFTPDLRDLEILFSATELSAILDDPSTDSNTRATAALSLKVLTLSLRVLTLSNLLESQEEELREPLKKYRDACKVSINDTPKSYEEDQHEAK